MVRSMTGYGRGEAERDGMRMVVELKTVNHRFLEPSIRMNRELLALENDLKALIGNRISRGKIDVFINFEPGEGVSEVKVNEDILQAYLTALREAGNRHDLPDDLKVSHILRIPDVLESRKRSLDPAEVWPVLEEAAGAALDGLNQMRAREGERIAADLLGKADRILELVSQLEASAPEVEQAYREKLEKRIAEALERMESGQLAMDRTLLENEVALFADRCCIDEELVRLKSHVSQLRELLASDEPVGRALDFLLQEFNRESNTIASKAGSLAVTQAALELKKEIEKIREQIQNIE